MEILSSNNYVSTENMQQDFAGIKDAISPPSSGTAVEFKVGDILISNIRPYLKKIWLSDRNGGCSTDVLALRAKNEKVDSSFLYCCLANDDFVTYVMSGAKGVKMPRGDKQHILSYNLGVPSVQEQRRIAELVSLLEKRISAQSKIIEELKTLRGALVDTYINDGNNNNENQTIMSLGAYGCFVRGLTYSSVDVTDNTATTGVVRSNNLEYGSPVDIKADLVYVTKKPSPEQMLVNGDIVICMANGSSSLVGKASNYQELCRNMTVGAFCGIYRGTHPLTKWIFMSSTYCKAVANAIQGGNGAIANLHAEDILSMCFAVPSDYKTITELGKLLSLFDEKLHAAEELLARFIEQKKYFLFKMFI